MPKRLGASSRHDFRPEERKMQWKVFPTMILIFTGLNGCASIELARQLPASLKPFQMIEKSAKSYMKRFRAAGCEFRILICA